MVIMNHSVRRFGPVVIVSEHIDTWSTLPPGNERQRLMRATAGWQYGPALLAAVALLVWHVELVGGVSAIVSGVAVFTALLFGLLALVFNMAVTIRKDGDAIGTAHDLKATVADLRANISYGVLVGFILAISLVVASVTADPTRQLHWSWTPWLSFLFIHMIAVLFTILRRFRTAFNYLMR